MYSIRSHRCLLTIVCGWTLFLSLLLSTSGSPSPIFPVEETEDEDFKACMNACNACFQKGELLQCIHQVCVANIKHGQEFDPSWMKSCFPIAEAYGVGRGNIRNRLRKFRMFFPW